MRRPASRARDARSIGRLLGLAVLVSNGAACDGDRPTRAPVFEVPHLGLELPRLIGWEVDPSVKVDDAAKGGVVFRLVRASPVALSPRIDVYLEPLRTRPTVLEDFLTQNLREMAQYEASDAIRITGVEQRPVSVGPRRGYRVQHEYSMTGGDGGMPIAITQVSTLFVLDGRGIAVTAPGRTELFHPLGEQIEKIMSGIALPVPSGAAVTPVVPPPGPAPVKPDAPGVPTGIQPIDLGKLGGK